MESTCDLCQKIFKNSRSLKSHKIWCGKPRIPRIKKEKKEPIFKSTRHQDIIKKQKEEIDYLTKELFEQYDINRIKTRLIECLKLRVRKYRESVPNLIKEIEQLREEK